MVMPVTWLYVLGFGAAGVGLRFSIDLWLAKWSLTFPLGTLLINIGGCLIAGLVFGFAGQEKLAEDPIRLGLIVGFCGGFTTFSGFGIQVLQLFEGGQMTAALMYTAASPLLCILATGGGIFLSRAFI